MSGALRQSPDAAVRAALERALSEIRGAPSPIAELIRRPFAYETSFAIDELDVRLGDGERLALLVKDVGAAGLTAEAAATKPAHTLDPGREISVYRDLLGPAGLSTPRFHGAAVEPERERWWLFLERVEGEVLTDVGELSVWCEAAGWAGRLDRAVDGGGSGSALLERGSEWHERWLDAAIAALGDDPLAGRLGAARSRLLERLDALPRAFVHGELYPANVLAARGEGRARIAPVDWELAGSGPYALDLAALVSGWGREDREAMCRRFHQALLPGAPTFEELLAAVELCELFLALQWIGWAPGWVPPEAQRRDWPAEAARLLGAVLP
ncbi:MAG TPA: aminoglycoside phosphotransferase family protein [Solirubrobacterales bacterium]|nr:aminoglycoside phosphotransferase family protein [Solirubrobacterales bacterium]